METDRRVRLPDHSLSTAHTVQKTAPDGQKLRHPKIIALSQFPALRKKEKKNFKKNKKKKKKTARTHSPPQLQSNATLPSRQILPARRQAQHAQYRPNPLLLTTTNTSPNGRSLPHTSSHHSRGLKTQCSRKQEWKTNCRHPTPPRRTGWEKHARDGQIKTLGNHPAGKRKGQRESESPTHALTHLTRHRRKEGRPAVASKRGRTCGAIGEERMRGRGELLTYMRMRCDARRQQED